MTAVARLGVPFPRRRHAARLVRLAVAVAVLAVAAGCGVADEEIPRDIPPAQRGDLSDPSSAAGVSPAGGRRIFFVLADGGQASVLRSVARDVGDSPAEVMTSLLSGPTAAEQASRLRTAIPEGTLLLGAQFVSQGTLQIDLSATIFDATGDALIDAVAQVVYTSNEIEGVDRVLLRVDGQEQRWPRGDGTLVSGPLTVFDYPGRVFTTQPDFPALPTPNA